MKSTDTLYIIPARGGSKGIPGKNIRPLAGKPLLLYSIEVARELAPDSHILLSTDSEEIAEVGRKAGLTVDYMRPDSFATDTAGSREVIIDAMDYADSAGIRYCNVCLLQPTSPLRTPDDIRGALALYRPELDMVVSVCEVAANPYYNCFEPDPATGYLHISKGEGKFVRRQDAPPAWEFNGAVYIINPEAIRAKKFSEMDRRLPYPMPRERSVDIDTLLDWTLAETILSKYSTQL